LGEGKRGKPLRQKRNYFLKRPNLFGEIFLLYYYLKFFTKNQLLLTFLSKKEGAFQKGVGKLEGVLALGGKGVGGDWPNFKETFFLFEVLNHLGFHLSF